jgi:hypothetical protein
MDIATTAAAAPAVAATVIRERAARPAARPADVRRDADDAVLTPVDPWTDALAQCALAAGRARDLALAADAAGWPEALAAHGLFLARWRVRDLETLLACPDDAPGRVVCWSA